MTTVPVRAPEGAPNVLVILFDDLGFAQLGCYGSDVHTPNIDRLAHGGLRYNRFHVTALCSPSRAALLTGRNHHAVGMGFLADVPLDMPGYNGHRPDGAGTVAEHLVDAGYSAYAVGKWHLTPGGERSHSGPFGTWPLGWGFERYYGFLGGDANHWEPHLVCDNHYVESPDRRPDGYHLTEDLADRTIRLLRDQHQATPDKPFVAYFALGAMHAPHHVAADWVERYRGRFDDGWDAARERVFARQQESGLIPPDARLSERPSWVADWGSLSDDDRRLYARMQETYAGFLSHSDAQIGRVIDHLEATGQLDNTLVLLMSDNGASAEGGTQGTANEMRFSNRYPESTERNLAYIDDWGGHRTYSHYAWGWAWAGNTPFRLWKRYTWLGGTRSPLVVHWPAGIPEHSRGGVRDQISHIVDVMPTVLDACGVPQASTLAGVPQTRVDGASLVPSFSDADAPNPRDTQYFEMLGSRSIIHGEWKATTDHVSLGVADEEALMDGSRDFETDRWALFDLRADYSETTDLADQHPDVLADLQARWDVEAERNHVLPMKDSLTSVLGSILPRPYTAVPPCTYVPDASPVIDDALPRLMFGGSVIAQVEIPAGSPTQGIVCALGDWNGGFAIYLHDGLPHAVVNAGGDPTIVRGNAPLTPGEHSFGFRITAVDTHAEIALDVDGDAVSTAKTEHGVPASFQHGGAALHLGRDTGFPVCDDYTTPFPFTGTLHAVTIDSPIGRPTADEIAASLRAD